MTNQSMEPENQKFFKYMSCSTGRIVLENKTLRWTTPATLNDPYDGQFDLHIDVDLEQVKIAILEKQWRSYSGEEPVPVGNAFGYMLEMLRAGVPDMSRQKFIEEFRPAVDESIERGMRALSEIQIEVRSLIARCKVLCLTQTAINSLMWTHYADNHQGVVLRFRSVPELDSPWLEGQPINYKDQMPRLLDAEFLSDMLSGRTSLDMSSVIDRMLFTKSAEWSYEQEWRLMSGMGRDHEAPFEDITFHPLELDAVVFGTRIPEDKRVAIVEIVGRQYPHAELLQIGKNQREFRLEVTPYVRQ